MYDDPGWERITVGQMKRGDRLARDGKVLARRERMHPLPWSRLHFEDGTWDEQPNNQLFRVFRPEEPQMRIGES